MTDQTRWGIPELQAKNKARRHQQLIYDRAMDHASRLTDQNKQKLIEELQKGMQKDHGSVQNDSKKQGVATGVARVSGGVAKVANVWRKCGNGHNLATIKQNSG